VAAAKPVSGQELRERFLAEMPALTLGLIRARGNSLRVGPIELLRFGRPSITGAAVEWPIEGGLLVGSPGGRWRIASSGDQLVASVEGYRPMLPRQIYALTQVHAHHLLTRLLLLRVRGRVPEVGIPVESKERIQAAAVDVAFCFTLARLFGRKPRLLEHLGTDAWWNGHETAGRRGRRVTCQPIASGRAAGSAAAVMDLAAAGARRIRRDRGYSHHLIKTRGISEFNGTI
jgi:hypothetical protein